LLGGAAESGGGAKDRHGCHGEQNPRCPPCWRPGTKSAHRLALMILLVCFCCDAAPGNVIIPPRDQIPRSALPQLQGNHYQEKRRRFGCHVSGPSPNSRQAKSTRVLSGRPKVERHLLVQRISGSVLPCRLNSNSVLSLAGNHLGEHVISQRETLTNWLEDFHRWKLALGVVGW
jgi:hypothetical protein